MAPGIQLEPETFYQLKNSCALYLDGTDFEGVLGVTVMTFFFPPLLHPRGGNHDIVTLRHSILTYNLHFCLQIFFTREAKVCYFLCSLSHISYKLCVIVILSYSRWCILWN